MGNQECAQALFRTLKQFGIKTFPWQRLRDFAALRLLLADPKALVRVANMLGIKNPVLVHLRYAAMLPRDGGPGLPDPNSREPIGGSRA